MQICPAGQARTPHVDICQPPQRSPALLMNSSRGVADGAGRAQARSQDSVAPTSELLAGRPEQPPARPQYAISAEKAEPTKNDRYSPSNAIYLRLSAYQRFGDVHCSPCKANAEHIDLQTAENSGRLGALNALRAHKSPEALSELQQSIKQRTGVLLKDIERRDEHSAERRIEAHAADSFFDYERLFDEITYGPKAGAAESQKTAAGSQTAGEKRDQKAAPHASEHPDCKQAFQKAISAAPSRASGARNVHQHANQSKTQKAARQKPVQLTHEQIVQKAAESLQRQHKSEQSGSAGHGERTLRAERERFIERQLTSPIGDERIIARTDRTTGVTTYQNTPRVEMSVLAQKLGVK